MSDLQTLANLAEILGGLTIVGGAIFGIAQMREFRAQRRQAAAMELNRSFHAPGFSRAIALLRGLPDGISAKDLRARGPEYEQAALMVATTFETISYMVFRELASFSMVQELAGGMILTMWRKLERWTTSIREEQSQPSWAEWYEWLAVQLARESSAKEGEPAYQRYADWRPRE